MAVSVGPIASVRLVAADAARLADFYAEAFGFEHAEAGDFDPEGEARLLGLDGGKAATRTLRLGAQRIDLLSITPAGRPYPSGTGSADTIFQHVALVVRDMAAAMARLGTQSGWSLISTDGPEHLPAASGGVTAFKFRDPEGHPLEFLEFPAGAVPPAWAGSQVAGPCLGYDHSAIAVADTARSLAFYGRLGLARASGSLNRGAEQSRMDAVPDALVEVTGLGVPGAPPHLELLCYRGGTAATPTQAADVAATQVVFTVADGAALRALVEPLGAHLASPGIVALGEGHEAAMLRDPDGHRLILRTPD